MTGVPASVYTTTSPGSRRGPRAVFRPLAVAALAERRLEILRGSDRALLAPPATTGRLVGFVTAITDGVLSAFIPLLEVLPEYQGQGSAANSSAASSPSSRIFTWSTSSRPELEPFDRRFD